MSLFIRLNLTFWQHRKTMRLRALIGDAAMWVPPRLWSYAANNQPDGDFSKYLPEELAALIGYLGNAQALLEALQAAGFLDGMKIHDWAEYNGYHSTFADRAKKAAAARWEKENAKKDQKEKDKEKRREEKRQALLGDAKSNAQAFDTFWKEYPRKVGKANARAAWAKLSCDDKFETIIAAVKRCRESADWKKDGGQYAPHPATWLNREGWEDELISAATASAAKPVEVSL